ncbi:MAG: Signal transduction histidine kinase [Actinomycetia bacterium]|nr:Signal transduction histidine kinase [Actinomycetes bacterium]
MSPVPPLRAARGWVDLLFVAIWSGRADPPPPAGRPWPVALRWTKRIGIGRLRFGLVVFGFDLLLALIILAPATAQLAGPDGGRTGRPLLTAVFLVIPLVLRHRYPLGAWRLSALGMFYTTFVFHIAARRADRTAPHPGGAAH